MCKKYKLYMTVILIIVVIIFSLFLYIHTYTYKQVKAFIIQDYKEEIMKFSSEKIFGYTKNVGEIVNSESAKSYAEKIWLEIYGESIKNKKPYVVYWDAENTAWLITGTMKKNMLGGIPYIIFSEKDGEIIAVWHTK